MPERRKDRRQASQAEAEEIRQTLLDRKKTLWNHILQQLDKEAGQRHQGVVDTIRESGDRALEELLESHVLYMVERKARELEDIEAALNRMDSGEYGRCMDCGRWIRPARLKVMPYSVRCTRCQEQHEKLENV